MPFDFSFSDVLAWLVNAMPYVFIGALVAYLGLGITLDYHWTRYGVGLIQKFKFRLGYSVMGLILFGVMGFALMGMN